ncbi:MAG: flagellar biosynthesis protein FlhF [Bacillota bacterium]|jgi:flagellar biosynthesis protein FlhF|nr:flagellar biosynthesis protein FlhF [Bacillota bacterium]NLV63189.1 flagellar biosynthesis protein FlhF [Clostridiaceae bacterium]
MRIRRYTGKDAQEAMLKVKMDLGSEAVILSTRKIKKKGIFGFLKKPLTEVLAAIDDDYGNKKNDKPAPSAKIRKTAGFYGQESTVDSVREENDRVSLLESKLKQMESMLNKIYTDVVKEKTQEQKEKREAHGAADTIRSEAVKVQQTVSQTGTDMYKSFERVLAESEIEPVIIDRMLEKIKQLVKNPGSINDLFGAARKILVNILGEPQTISFREDGKPTVVIFLGPTGVGKTTTLAKIAADYSLNHEKKIGFITADTYRIAAVEQLKTYAEILNIPISVIYTPEEIKEAILNYSDKDLILVDTAGRSHKNAEQFAELKMLVASAQADEVFLVLSCNLGRTACKEIISHYGFLKNYKLLFTKLDEAPVPGIILNIRYATGKRLSYTTAGQCVPDDIEVANVENIVKSILRTS